MTKQTHLKLAAHFEKLANESQNYPDAQRKFKELAEYNRKKGEGL